MSRERELTEEEVAAVVDSPKNNGSILAIAGGIEQATRHKLVVWLNEECPIPKHDPDNWAEHYPRHECSMCKKDIGLDT